MKINKIEILIRKGEEDRIYLITNLPPTFPNNPDESNMTMKFNAQQGTGLKYLITWFGDMPDMPATATIIDGNKGTRQVVSISEILLA
jgi:hypothetical protein